MRAPINICPPGIYCYIVSDSGAVNIERYAAWLVLQNMLRDVLLGWLE